MLKNNNKKNDIACNKKNQKSVIELMKDTPLIFIGGINSTTTGQIKTLRIIKNQLHTKESNKNDDQLEEEDEVKIIDGLSYKFEVKDYLSVHAPKTGNLSNFGKNIRTLLFKNNKMYFSSHKNIHCYDMELKKTFHIFEDHTRWIYKIKFLENGKYKGCIASCSSDQTLRVFDIKEKKSVFEYKTLINLNSFAETSKGDILLNDSKNGFIIINIEKNKIILKTDEKNRTKISNYQVWSLIQLTNGEFVSGTSNGTIIFFNNTLKEFKICRIHKSYVFDICELLNQQNNKNLKNKIVCVSASRDQNIIAWDCKKKELLFKLNRKKHVNPKKKRGNKDALKINELRNGNLVVSYEDGYIMFWNLSEKSIIKILYLEDEFVCYTMGIFVDHFKWNFKNHINFSINSKKNVAFLLWINMLNDKNNSFFNVPKEILEHEILPFLMI